MPKKAKPTDDDFSRLHIEIETVVLNELRRLHPEYGGVSQVIRKLVKGYVRTKLERL